MSSLSPLLFSLLLSLPTKQHYIILIGLQGTARCCHLLDLCAPATSALAATKSRLSSVRSLFPGSSPLGTLSRTAGLGRKIFVSPASPASTMASSASGSRTLSPSPLVRLLFDRLLSSSSLRESYSSLIAAPILDAAQERDSLGRPITSDMAFSGFSCILIRRVYFLVLLWFLFFFLVFFSVYFLFFFCFYTFLRTVSKS
jgi:hypothetical protein